MAPERDLAGDATALPEAGPGDRPAGRGATVESWERYELLERLGAGGMGEVHKARDRRLGRIVAVKFIRGVDPNLTMRLVREARAQARIDHPNVCRVHEVGELDGRAYIALQFVDGEPLHAAAARMALDEAVAAMRDVALAIHEAHRLGIVHRDVKPANILVERTEDGRWVPIVMDFGLAREVAIDSGLTASGALLGTPAYMSPEQARGDVHAVDRRSDVYSLGATLYELLTGRPPFAGGSLAAMLAQAIHDDPPAPRSVVASVPVDLETIALKCLAKDPAQRYPSARALADDLARYLDGEPILGRRLSRWQTLRRRARRHRALVVLGAWSLAIIVVVATLGVRAWLASRAERARTADRAGLAERLGREAKELELFLRSANLLPLHDTRPERDIVRERMRAIAATPHDLGALGDAVIHDAVGRGHLALYHWREAADELIRAAAAGRRTPELHAALGRARGELYHRSLEDARRSADPASLARRKAALEQQYLAPALVDLAQSRDAGDSAAMLDALVALYRRDFAAAESRARAISERAPWLFEARKLAAEAAYGAAVEAFDRGSYDVARPGLDRAEALYAQAGEIARSDGALYEAAAQTALQRAELEFRQGQSPREPLERALVAIERALRVDPDDAQAHMTRGYILLRWYQTPALRIGDQRPLLERIAEADARAVELDPGDARAWDALANAHVFRGIYESLHGGQGAPWWNRALDELAAALMIEPDDAWANNDAGVAQRWLGANLDAAGRDPLPAYQAALHSYERATTIDPHYVYAWANQADLQVMIADHEQTSGRDPRAAVEGALRAGERCLAVDPSYYAVLNTMAQAQLSLARHLVETGGDPTAAVTGARGSLDRAEALHPGHMVTWFYRLIAAGAEAAFVLRQGGDPTGAITVGRAALTEALRRSPDSSDCYSEAARLDLVEAGWLERTRRSAASALTRALADAEKAIALDDQFAEAKLVAAEVCLQIATAQRAPAVAARGIAYVDQALALNPRLARAAALRAALVRLP